MKTSSSSSSLMLGRRSLLVAAAGAVLARPSLAAGYPDKPLKIIVPYVPGGGADILARYMAQMLTAPLGQPVIVENRGGAGGMIGVDVGLAAPADGSVLTLISSSYTVNPSLYKLKYDPVRDIVPIGQMSAGPLLVVVNAKSPIRTLADLAKAARAKPGQLTYASSGQGSALHLAAAQFARLAGVQMNHIPYKGGGAALTDVMSGQVDSYFAATASAMPHVEAGRLRALAVTTTAASPRCRTCRPSPSADFLATTSRCGTASSGRMASRRTSFDASMPNSARSSCCRRRPKSSRPTARCRRAARPRRSEAASRGRSHLGATPSRR